MEEPILNESEQIVIVPGWNVDMEDVVQICVETDKSKLYRGSISDGQPNGFQFEWTSSATITTERTPEDKEFQITIQQSKDGGHTWGRPFSTHVGGAVTSPYCTSSVIIENEDSENTRDGLISFKYLDKNCTYSLRALKRDRALKASQSDLHLEHDISGSFSPRKTPRVLLKEFADDLRESTLDLLRGSKGEDHQEKVIKSESPVKGSSAGKESKEEQKGSAGEHMTKKTTELDEIELHEEEKKEAEDKPKQETGKGGEGEKKEEGKGDKGGKDIKEEDDNTIEMPAVYCEYKCIIL